MIASATMCFIEAISVNGYLYNKNTFKYTTFYEIITQYESKNKICVKSEYNDGLLTSPFASGRTYRRVRQKKRTTLYKSVHIHTRASLILKSRGEIQCLIEQPVPLGSTQ